MKEIKKAPDELLSSTSYIAGVWNISKVVTEGVNQIQKTAFEFTHNQMRKFQPKNKNGENIGTEVFRIQPKSFLVIGNLSELLENEDKITCFQLFRNSLISPEIVTFDELFERAKCIVETLSEQN